MQQDMTLYADKGLGIHAPRRLRQSDTTNLTAEMNLAAGPSSQGCNTHLQLVALCCCIASQSQCRPCKRSAAEPHLVEQQDWYVLLHACRATGPLHKMHSVAGGASSDENTPTLHSSQACTGTHMYICCMTQWGNVKCEQAVYATATVPIQGQLSFFADALMLSRTIGFHEDFNDEVYSVSVRAPRKTDHSGTVCMNFNRLGSQALTRVIS